VRRGSDPEARRRAGVKIARRDADSSLVNRFIGLFFVGCALSLVADPASGDWSQPAPTAQYVSLLAARDSIGAIVSRSISKGDTAIHVSRRAVTLEYRYVMASAAGWAFHIVVTDTSVCPDMAVKDALAAAGWVEDFQYGADGTDGSTAAFLCRNFFCLIEGHWDGGDDTDDSYVPAPGCEVILTCVPRREDDVPPP
jgi:hypothetical protein